MEYGKKRDTFKVLSISSANHCDKSLTTNSIHTCCSGETILPNQSTLLLVKIRNMDKTARALDKREYLMIILDNFSYFSMKLYVVTPHLNRLIEMVQMRGTTYVFNQN